MSIETFGQSVSSYVKSAASKVVETVDNVTDMVVDPTKIKSEEETSGTVYSTMAAQRNGVKTQNMDRRARLRPRSGAEDYVYGDSNSNGLMTILRETNGLVFPETPTISEGHSVNYSTNSPTHSITQFNSFNSVGNVTINLSGDFHATNATEAKYVLACIHFLRSVTKMDFGTSSVTRGTPPPILLFSAYGNFMYNDIPVIIKSANFDLASDIDYIQVPLNGSSIDYASGLVYKDTNNDDKADRVWVPTRSTFTLLLEQQITGEWAVDDFDLNSFKRGDLLTKGGII